MGFAHAGDPLQKLEDRGVVERLAGDPAACRPGRDDDARHTETGADRQVIDKFPRRARGGNGRRDMIEQPIILVVIEDRSEEHTSELQSLMRSSYAGFCLKKKNITQL